MWTDSRFDAGSRSPESNFELDAGPHSTKFLISKRKCERVPNGPSEQLWRRAAVREEFRTRHDWPRSTAARPGTAELLGVCGRTRERRECRPKGILAEGEELWSNPLYVGFQRLSITHHLMS